MFQVLLVYTAVKIVSGSESEEVPTFPQFLAIALEIDISSSFYIGLTDNMKDSKLV